ncbi:energy transducer TonB, partial [Bacteroides xylanisolvens]
MRKIINKNYSINIFFTNRLHFAVKYFFLHLSRVLYMYIYYINFEGEQTMKLLT